MSKISSLCGDKCSTNFPSVSSVINRQLTSVSSVSYSASNLNLDKAKFPPLHFDAYSVHTGQAHFCNLL